MNAPKESLIDVPENLAEAQQQEPMWRTAAQDFVVDRRRTLRERLSHRLREDFMLAMVTLFGLIAVVVISPFAVFRPVNGDLEIALLGLGIVVAIMTGVVIAWRFDKSEPAGTLMATIFTAGAAVSVLGLGISQTWILAVLAANFLLAPSWLAAILSAVLISLFAVSDLAFAEPIERWTFLAVSTQIALYSFITAVPPGFNTVAFEGMRESFGEL